TVTLWSKRKAGMAEKRKRQRGCPANAAETRADCPLDLAEVVRAEVGQFAALDVAPHEFGGIELRRVARQALNGKPRALSRQVRGHVAACMRRQAIPDQEETPTAKMILELVQEADERDVERAQEAPEKPRVILHAGHALDHQYDTRQGPEPGTEAMRAGALAQGHVDAGQLFRSQSRLTPFRTAGSARAPRAAGGDLRLQRAPERR